jgi:hypothetical protein
LQLPAGELEVRNDGGANHIFAVAGVEHCLRLEQKREQLQMTSQSQAAPIYPQSHASVR